MKKVLVIAYYFPPLGGAGVQRTLKFVKYLPDFGWESVVLTAQQPGPRLKDNTLAEDIPGGLKVYRTLAVGLPARLPWRVRNFLTRWVLTVDEQLGWLPFAVWQARKIIQQEEIAAILTTSAPFTAHLIGKVLHQQTKLPWLADFRDPWLGNFSNTFATSWHARLCGRLEKQIIDQANEVTVVSPPMQTSLETRYPNQTSGRVHVLTNGFDPADFKGVAPEKRETDRFLIVYSGSFYGKRQQPTTFFRGVHQAIEKGLIPADRLFIRLVGSTGKAIQDQIAAFGLGAICEVTGYVSHAQSIAHLRAADGLLLLIGSGPGSEAVYTGKLFEYLAAGKTILALAPPGVAADLIREARAGVVVDPDNMDAICSQIVDYYRKWQQGKLTIASQEEIIARFNRRTLTQRLAAILDEITK